MSDYYSNRTQEVPVPTLRRLNSLGEAKENKVTSLSGPSTDTEYGYDNSGTYINSIPNDLNPAEVQYLYGKNLSEGTLGLPGEETYDGPKGRLYGFGTNREGQGTEAYERDLKVGYAGSHWGNSSKRYDKYPAGPEGVNKNDPVFDISMKEANARFGEALINGNAQRDKQVVIQDEYGTPEWYSQYKKLGSGGTEIVARESDGSGIFGSPTGEGLTDRRKLELDQFMDTHLTNIQSNISGGGNQQTNTDNYVKPITEQEADQWSKDNRTTIGEVSQVGASTVANLAKGAIDLFDAIGELVTWAPQTLHRKVTGDESIDWKFIGAEDKKYIQEGIDSFVDYARGEDDLVIEQATKDFEDSGIDLTSTDSIYETFADPERRSLLGKGALDIVSDPSLLIGFLAQTFGSGLGLGGLAKGSAFVSSKIAPDATKKITNVLELNKTKLSRDVKALHKSGKVGASKAEALALLKKEHTLGKKVSDLVKGGAIINSQHAIMMNDQLDQFKANNNNVDADTGKVVSMFFLTRVGATLNGGAMQHALKPVKSIGTKLAKDSVGKFVGEHLSHIVKNGAIEGIQELSDGLIEVVNTKLDSSDYQDKTLRQIVGESSSELLVSLTAGVGTGAILSGANAARLAVLPGVEQVRKATATKLTEKGKSKDIIDEDTKLDLSPERALDISGRIKKGLATEITEDSLSGLLDNIEEISSYHQDLIQDGSKNPDSIKLVEDSLASLKEKFTTYAKEGKVTTLGSSDFEALSGLLLEGSQEVDLEDVKTTLKKVAENTNNMSGYKSLVKNYVSVGLEAEEGGRGYRTYGRLINKYSVDKGDKNKLKAHTNSARAFLASQLSAKEKLETGLHEAKQLAEKYTNQKIGSPKKGKFFATKYRKATKDGGKGDYFNIYIRNDGNGKYYIDDANIKATQKLIDVKSNNIQGIKKALSKDTVTDPTQGNFLIDVNSGVSSKGRSVRQSDVSNFESLGITKAIVAGSALKQAKVDKDGKKAKNSKWYYYKDANSHLINQKDYEDGDVVLLDAGRVTRNKKTGSVRFSFAKSDAFNNAVEAGVTFYGDNVGKNEGLLVTTLNKVGYVKVKKPDSNGKLKTMYVPKGEEVVIKKQNAKDKAIADKKDAETQVRYEELVMSGLTGDKGRLKVAKESVKAEFIRDGLSSDAIDKNINSYFNNIGSKVAKVVSNAVYTSNTTEEKVKLALSRDKKLANLHKNSEFIAYVDNLYNLKSESVVDTESILEEWTKFQDNDNELSSFLKDRGVAAGSEISRIIETSSSKGSKPVYVTKSAGNKSKFSTSLNKGVEGEFITKAVLDIDDIITKGKDTILNTFKPESIAHLSSIEDVTTPLVKGIIKKLTTPSSSIDYDALDSPARGLLFNKEGNVNTNVSTAIGLSIGEILKIDKHKLTPGYKSKEDVARMFGIEESRVDNDLVRYLEDKGMLQKSLGNMLGKMVADYLGITSKALEDVDAQNYDALLADLGNMAILAGVEAKVFEATSVSTVELVNKLGKNVTDIKDTKTRTKFISYDEDFDVDFEDLFNTVEESLPKIGTLRKSYSTKVSSDKVIASKASKIRNDKVGAKVHKKAQESLTNLMKEAWKADATLISNFLSYDKDVIKGHLGYVEEGSAKYKSLSWEDKQIVEVTNREVEKSLDELRMFVKSGDVDNDIFFNYFYSANRRFFIDSNGLNPQVDKLHRFLVTPKEHNLQYTSKGGAFSVEVDGDDKDITDRVHYALAQAFGMEVDKVGTKEVESFALELLGMSGKEVSKMEKKLLKKGASKFTLDNHVVTIEHLGHLVQGIDFLKKAKSPSFTSSLSAEMDAATSGFAIKLLQFPILNNLMPLLEKVGVVKGKDSLNELIGGDKDFHDNYQSLAKGINKISSKGIANYLVKIYTEGKDSKLPIVANEELFKRTGMLSKYIHRRKGKSDAMGTNINLLIPSTIGGKVSKELRSMFKSPFMVFNYAASIKSIRENLAQEVIKDIVNKLVKADLKDTDSFEYKLLTSMTKVITKFKVPGENTVDYNQGKGSAIGVQNMLKTIPLHNIKIEGNLPISTVFETTVDVAVGSQVQSIFEKDFGPYIELQETTNSVFTLAFGLFKVEYEKILSDYRSKGEVITKAKSKDIVTSLLDKFPIIKGPLGGDLIEGIPIHSSVVASPGDMYEGRISSGTKVTRNPEATGKKAGSYTIRHLIKKLDAAVSSGSVMPIHFIDGVQLSEVVNDFKGMVIIHDAVIPPLTTLWEAGERYSKSYVETNRNYSVFEQVEDLFNRTKKSIEEASSSRQKVNIKTTAGREDLTLTEAVDYLDESVQYLSEEIARERSNLFSLLDKGDYSVSHMVGSKNSVHRTKKVNKVNKNGTLSNVINDLKNTKEVCGI